MKTPLKHCVRALLACGLALIVLKTASALPVVPGLVGNGTQTVAGRGTTAEPAVIYKVTSLDDPGYNQSDLVAGTLRYGVEHSSMKNKARVIIFEKSGVIELKRDLIIRPDWGQLTIAGQTAPWPGITLRNAGVQVQASEVLVQHIAIRPGNYENSATGWSLPGLDNRDCIKLEPAAGVLATNIVFDHVSCSWATDEVMSVWAGGSVDGATISRSLLGQPVQIAGHGKGQHGYGSLVGKYAANVSLIRNVMAFNWERNPLVRDRADSAQWVNNFIYRPGHGNHRAMYIGTAEASEPNRPLTVSVVGNVIIRHPPYTFNGTSYPTVTSTGLFVAAASSTNVSTFVEDNRLFNPATGLWYPAIGDSQYSSPFFMESAGNPVAPLGTNPHANSGGWTWVPWASGVVEAKLVASSGKSPARRDALDAALFSDIQTRNGTFVASMDPSTNPWAPVDLQHTRALTTPTNPQQDPDGDGYTNLEEWLHHYAWDIEGDPRVAVFDTFEDNDLNGWYPDDAAGAWSVVTDGSKVLQQTYTGGEAQAFLSNTNFFNQVVQATVKPVSFNGTDRFVRIYARYRDPFNSYYVTMRNGASNQVQLRKITHTATSTAITTFDQANFTISPGTAYAVRLSVNNASPGAPATLTARVTNLSNNQFVDLSGSDTEPLPPGFAAVGTYYASAKFDDVFASPHPTDVLQTMSDFDAGSAPGWTPAAPTAPWQTTGGVYQFTDKTAVSGRTVAGTDVSSQTVQADVKIVETNSANRFAAVYARHSDAINCYYLLLRADQNQVELKKLVNNVPTELDVEPLAVNLNEWNNLRLEVSGTNPVQLRGYVNGVLRVEGQDSGSGLPAGKAALGTNYVAAEFDDVIVTSP